MTKKNILTLVLSEEKSLNETKNHNPPFKLNGRPLKYNYSYMLNIKNKSRVINNAVINIQVLAYE